MRKKRKVDNNVAVFHSTISFISGPCTSVYIYIIVVFILPIIKECMVEGKLRCLLVGYGWKVKLTQWWFTVFISGLRDLLQTCNTIVLIRMIIKR